jgi:hypothetical protein
MVPPSRPLLLLASKLVIIVFDGKNILTTVSGQAWKRARCRPLRSWKHGEFVGVSEKDRTKYSYVALKLMKDVKLDTGLQVKGTVMARGLTVNLLVF